MSTSRLTISITPIQWEAQTFAEHACDWRGPSACQMFASATLKGADKKTGRPEYTNITWRHAGGTALDSCCRSGHCIRSGLADKGWTAEASRPRRGSYQIVLERLIRIFLALLALCILLPVMVFCALVLDFRARSDFYKGRDPVPAIAVVFSGSHDRIYLAMDLLEQDVIAQVFISGANPRSGIRTQSFAKDFNLSPAAMADLESGKVVFAPDATSTLENAVETACWLNEHPEITEVTLITSHWHMPRSSVALERSLTRRVKIVRFPSEPAAEKYEGKDVWREEFIKYTATWFASIVPSAIWPADKRGCAGQ